MSGTLGRVEEFDGNRDDWPEYVEQVEHFFLANGIDSAEKKRAVFLSVIGPSTYKTLRNLVSPEKPGDKSYGDLVAALSMHFKPAPSEIVERFKFHSRSRQLGESVAAFVAELRALAEVCNFGTTLDVMLRDRIVCGINDDAIQRRLLAELGLDYAKVVETARNMEAAARSMKELKSGTSGTPSTSGHASGGSTAPQATVHRASSATISQESGLVSRPGPTCYCCGVKGHIAAKCIVDKKVVCHQCGKRGHIRRACKAKPNRVGGKGKGKSRTVCRVEGDEEEPEPAGAHLCHVKSRGVAHSPPILVQVKLDDCLVSMEVDTYGELWPGRVLQPSQVRLQSYSKETIPVVGCCYVNLEYKGQTAKLPLLVVAGSGPTLLGRDWLGQVRLDWQQIHQVHSVSLQELLAKYPAVFKEGLGTLKGYEAKIHVDPDAVPKFHRARTVPYAL